jgi:hypothetical protein
MIGHPRDQESHGTRCEEARQEAGEEGPGEAAHHESVIRHQTDHELNGQEVGE